MAARAMVLALREVGLAVGEGKFDEAAAGLNRYRERMTATVVAMEAAKPWSLFDESLHDRHFAAMRNLLDAAGTAGTN